MSAFSDSAFSTSALSDAAFDFGSAPVVVDTKGWPGRKKRRERFFDDERRARARLREQIRYALEGPHTEQVQAAISEYIAPQRTDSRYIPVAERVRWDLLYRNLELAETAVLMHMAAAEDDDDEDLLILNG